MKLKCRPKDLQVVEVTERRPDGDRFALYRLEKVIKRLVALPANAHG